jgi:phospholipid/cholesterol/gamma-HCH transport system substrate-binding protein
MKRSGEIRWGEVRLGLVIFTSMALFLWASIQGAESFFHHKRPLRSLFSNVQGVVAGAPIWFEGVEVGSVKDLDFVNQGDSSRVLVKFVVEDRIWNRIRKDSRVRIQALNLFGEKFIEVTPGSPKSPGVSDDDLLPSEKPTDVAEIMERGSAIVDDLSVTTKDLAAIVHKVRNGEGSIGKMANSSELYDALVSTTRRTDDLIAHLDKSQGEMRSALVSVSTTLDSLARGIQRGDGTFGRLAKDPALYDHLLASSVHMDTALARVDRGEGNLGQLSKDEKLYQNLQQSLDRLNQLLADVQRNPKKYFGFSLF